MKDSKEDSDVITDIDKVHPVGIFAQITSTFEATVRDANAVGKDGADADNVGTIAKDGAAETVNPVTLVLFPLRRIRIDELVKQPLGGVIGGGAAPVPIAQVVEEVQKDELAETESEVASFEQSVPSVTAIKDEVTDSADGEVGMSLSVMIEFCATMLTPNSQARSARPRFSSYAHLLPDRFFSTLCFPLSLSPMSPTSNCQRKRAIRRWCAQ